MDWILAVGGLLMVGIGLVGKWRPNLLWRLYSLEPRWRKDNPEQPDNWKATASKQGGWLIGFGIITVMLAIVLVQMTSA